MTKRYVNWKPVTCTSPDGRKYQAELPSIIELRYRGTLLARILEMPKKRPISLDDAVRMAGRKYVDTKEIGHARGENHWYFDCFVEWISEIGYHIELTGDEFDAPVLSDKVV